MRRMNAENVKMYVNSQTGSLAEYLKVVSDSALEFSKRRKKTVTKLMPEIQKFWQERGLPDLHVEFIQTNGLEAFGLPYTRHNAVILPYTLKFDPLGVLDNLSSNLIVHEIFHVLSRRYPFIKKELYSVFGFEKVDEVKKEGFLTNPDCPNYDYKIRLETPEKSFDAVLCLRIDNKEMKWKDVYDLTNDTFLPVKETNLIDFIGKNTTYIIHPEEICAEYFRIMFHPKLIKDQESFNKYDDKWNSLIKENLFKKGASSL